MVSTNVPAERRYPPVPPPDSLYFAPLRDHCLSLAGAWEDYPWGETVYKVGKKIFAMINLREGTGPLVAVVKATVEDQEALIQLPGIRKAAYIGRYGWVQVEAADEAGVEFVKDLITASYELVAPKPRRKRS